VVNGLTKLQNDRTEFFHYLINFKQLMHNVKTGEVSIEKIKAEMFFL
jgi:hypothetical protein